MWTKTRSDSVKTEGATNFVFDVNFYCVFLQLLNFVASKLLFATQCMVWRLFKDYVNGYEHLEILSEIRVMPGKLQIAVSRHHSYFRQDF